MLELLDSEEVLLDVRLGLARLETDYMKTLAEMERAIGSAFPLEEIAMTTYGKLLFLLAGLALGVGVSALASGTRLVGPG